jgi:hypothetical protein
LSKAPNIPSAGLPEIPRPGMNMDPNVPALDIPTTTVPDKGLTAGNIPDIGLDDKLPEVKNLQQDQLKSIQAPDVSALSEKAEGYTSDVKDVRSSDLDKVVKEEEVINQLPARDEVKMLQEQEKTLQDEQAKLASYKHPEEYKKQTILRGRQMVAAQFAANEKQVQEAISPSYKLLVDRSRMEGTHDLWRWRKRAPYVTHFRTIRFYRSNSLQRNIVQV